MASDVDAARDRLEEVPDSELPPPPPEETGQANAAGEGETVDLEDLVGQQLPYDPAFAEGTDIPDEDFHAFLIIGSDEREGLGGTRADVIMLMLVPVDGGSPTLVSLPRDLYLPNPCHRSPTRINAALSGCGDLANGPELLAMMIDEYTGIQADHFTMFDFENFTQVIDAMGGVQVCVGPNPVRETTLFDLPAGCSTVDGDTALSWVRSRHTQELIDGEWQAMAGVNDLSRTERQQEVLLAMFSKVTTFRSLDALASVVAGFADVLVVDENLTVGQALGLAWDMRSVRPSTIERLRPDVEFHTTPGGASVLLPTGPFSEVLDQAESP